MSWKWCRLCHNLVKRSPRNHIVYVTNSQNVLKINATKSYRIKEYARKEENRREEKIDSDCKHNESTPQPPISFDFLVIFRRFLMPMLLLVMPIWVHLLLLFAPKKIAAIFGLRMLSKHQTNLDSIRILIILIGSVWLPPSGLIYRRWVTKTWM